MLPLLYTDARAGKYGKRDGPAALLLLTSNKSVDEVARRVERICTKTGEHLSVQHPMYVIRVRSAASELAFLRRSANKGHGPQAQLHPPSPTDLDLSDFAKSLSTIRANATDTSAGIVGTGVKLVNLSLGAFMMLMSGFETTSLAEKDQPRFARFRDFYRLYETGQLADEEVKRFGALTEELRQAVLRQADVVVTTVTMAAHKKLRTIIQPKTIIIDDAARAMEPDVWGLFAWYPRGVKVFFGDIQQLRPFVQSKGGFSEQLRLPIFARFMLLGYTWTSLEAQHRSIRRVVNLNNRIFGSGQLDPSKQIENKMRHQAKPFEVAIRTAYKTNFNRSVLLFDVDYSEDACAAGPGQYTNIHHVRVAMDAVAKLLNHGINGSQIAVLVPYLSQLSIYSFASATLAKGNPSFSDVHLETFDTVQSREYDFTIVDLVRTRAPGFLRDSRRVHVALSRARFGMVIVANRDQIKNNRTRFRDTPVAKIREVFASMKDSVVQFSARAEEELVEIPGLRDITVNGAPDLDTA